MDGRDPSDRRTFGLGTVGPVGPGRAIVGLRRLYWSEWFEEEVGKVRKTSFLSDFV